jgi:mannose-6-phosphate isomerase-like protein (cupin superfamily)
VTAKLTSVVVFAVVTSVLSAASQDAAPPKPAAQTTAVRPGSLALTITSEKGETLSGAAVAVHGTVDRIGASGMDGVVTLLNMPAGTYRCRITRDGFFTLEKEITIKAGARTATEGVLTAAPPPPPPPPQPTPAPVEPKPVPAAGPVGTPRVLSLAELGDQMLRDSKPIVERELGCSGVSLSRLILARENIAQHSHAEADEMLYLMAGEATLTVAEKDQNINAGWFGLVPRGSAHTLVRRGRNPMVVLSIQTGQPCK